MEIMVDKDTRRYRSWFLFCLVTSCVIVGKLYDLSEFSVLPLLERALEI